MLLLQESLRKSHSMERIEILNPLLLSLATANPHLYASREEAYQFLVSNFPMDSAERDLYSKVLLHGPIKGRYIGMHSFADACHNRPQDLIRRFQHFGARIAAKAAQKALQHAEVDVAEVSGLTVNTCTGYLCPGLSSYIAEELGLQKNIRVFDLMGMGCGAALPNLETCAGQIARDPRGFWLSIAVEICSATLFMGDEPDLVISNSIFADGASAAVVAADGASRPTPFRLQLMDFEAALHPEYREYLRYQNDNGRLKNQLHRNVPVIGAKVIAGVTDRLLSRNSLHKSDIKHWIVHAGGTSVLNAVQRKLDLTKEQLRGSYEIFEEYGNMSSPTVMYVLQRTQEKYRPSPGDKAVLLSFGAGFTGFGVLAQFRQTM